MEDEQLPDWVMPVLGTLTMALAAQMEPERQKGLCEHLYNAALAYRDIGQPTAGKVLRNLSDSVQRAAPATFEALGRAQRGEKPS